jgi:hypothetical protein
MRLLTTATLLGLLLVTLSGCLATSAPGATLTSSPPGARVLVEGKDSGWVTPCQMWLDVDEPVAVTFELPGYATRTVRLVPARQWSAVTWTLGIHPAQDAPFPALLPPEDLLLPFREDDFLAPTRVFVRLRPEDAP